MYVSNLRTKLLTGSDKFVMFLQRRKALLGLFAIGLCEKYFTVSCFAATEKPEPPKATSPANFLKDKGNDAFKSLQGTVENTGASLYSLVMSFAIVCLVLGLISIGLGFIFGGGRQKDESKSKLIFWIVGAVLIFGCISLIAYAQSIGSSL